MREFDKSPDEGREICENQKEITGQKIDFIDYLINFYKINFLVQASDTFIGLLRKIKKDNKKYQSALSVVRYGISSTLYASRIYKQYKHYKKYKNQAISTHDQFLVNIGRLVDTEFDIEKSNQSVYEIYLGKEVNRWLLNNPQTEDFKVLGYYSTDKFEKLSEIKDENISVCILIYMLNKKYVLYLRQSNYNGYTTVKDSMFYTILKDSEIREHSVRNSIRGLIFKEFLKHFDTKENVLLLSSGGLSKYSRVTIPEECYQLDIMSLSKEINTVLDKGRKRGIVLVGIPGTGKSTAIKKLETIITNYPIIYLSPCCFNGCYNIDDTFKTIEYIQPCLVIMEDMDSYDMADKTRKLGLFLSKIDDVNGKLNAVFIGTVNDTSLVHHSLMNRPGRLDEVFHINTPQKPEEVYSIMSCKFSKIEPDKKFVNFEEHQNLFKDVIDSSFTQADICEIVEKSSLMSEDGNITYNLLQKGCDCLKKSKDAIKLCCFKGENPNNLSGPELSSGDEQWR